MMLHFPGNMNEADLQAMIRAADRTFEEKLAALAEELDRIGCFRFFGLTGPTCSGKTTAARMLTERLDQLGYRVHLISIDDFYFEKNHLRALAEQKGSAELDYDSEDTIDLELLHECVASLKAGNPTRLPHFNFLTGLRECGVMLLSGEHDLFLFEGIQILYPKVHAILAGETYRSVAICPVSGIETGGKTFAPNEIRLMRRLVRDELYRGASASFTLSLWNSVRKNEEKNIFPYIGSCFHTVDSTMPYEIGILKPFLEKDLKNVPVSDPNFRTAQTILEKIRSVEPVSASMIAPNSLYREFI